MAGQKKKVIEQLAEKYHISYNQAKKAVESQYEFLSEKVKSGEYPEVRIPFLGLFKPIESRIKNIKKHRKEQNEQE